MSWSNSNAKKGGTTHAEDPQEHHQVPVHAGDRAVPVGAQEVKPTSNRPHNHRPYWRR
mgnify:CR=1 FL=1